MVIFHISESIKGGISSYIDEIILEQIDHFGSENIRIIIPAIHKKYLVNVPENNIIESPNKNRTILELLKFCFFVWKRIIVDRPDVIHIHSSIAGVSVRVLLFFLIWRPRVIYCAHGWSFGRTASPLLQSLFSLIEKILTARTDVIVNISEYESTLAKRHGIPPGKMVTVNNAIRIPTCRPTKFQTESDRLELLFVGRFDRQKGFDFLVRVIDAIPADMVRLTAIGEPVLGDISVTYPDNVRLLGWIPRDQLHQYYASADAVVVPSRWEPFGLVALEAMACGTAVIASNRGALPEIVDHGDTGIVFELSEPDVLVNVLRSLDRKKLRLMGQNGYRKIVRNYSAAELNKKIIQLYG